MAANLQHDVKHLPRSRATFPDKLRVRPKRTGNELAMLGNHTMSCQQLPRMRGCAIAWQIAIKSNAQDFSSERGVGGVCETYELSTGYRTPVGMTV